MKLFSDYYPIKKDKCKIKSQSSTGSEGDRYKGFSESSEVTIYVYEDGVEITDNQGYIPGDMFNRSDRWHTIFISNQNGYEFDKTQLDLY